MNGLNLFFMRYNVLYDFYLHYTWEDIPAELMRQRPHPSVNSIAWVLWHLTRVEDAALNRFVADRQQVLDYGGWYEKMGVPLRHNGFEMSKDQVDEFSQQIDLAALRGYSGAVRKRTLDIAAGLKENTLSETLPRERVAQVVLDEGLAGPGAEALVDTYTGWSKGMFLMNHGLTHSYQHVGEIGVIAGLLGLEF